MENYMLRFNEVYSYEVIKNAETLVAKTIKKIIGYNNHEFYDESELRPILLYSKELDFVIIVTYSKSTKIVDVVSVPQKLSCDAKNILSAYAPEDEIPSFSNELMKYLSCLTDKKVCKTSIDEIGFCEIVLNNFVLEFVEIEGAIEAPCNFDIIEID